MSSSNFFIFLQETLQRLFQKSPIFFKVWRIFWGAVIAVCGIPYLARTFEVELPREVAWLSSKFMTGMGAGALFMSKLTVKTDIVAQTRHGSPISVPDETKLPYTAKAEAKEMSETVPQPPVARDVPENEGNNG